ncbi:MAG: hypothetical protein ACYCS8_16330 [Acidithiobacillus sp.]
MGILPCPEPLAPFAEYVEAVTLWYRHFLAMQPNDYHGRRWAERMVESTLVMLYRRWDRREILAEGIRLACSRQACRQQAYTRQALNVSQTTRQNMPMLMKNRMGNWMPQHSGAQMNLL